MAVRGEKKAICCGRVTSNRARVMFLYIYVFSSLSFIMTAYTRSMKLRKENLPSWVIALVVILDTATFDLKKQGTVYL